MQVGHPECPAVRLGCTLSLLTRSKRASSGGLILAGVIRFFSPACPEQSIVIEEGKYGEDYIVGKRAG